METKLEEEAEELFIKLCEEYDKDGEYISGVAPNTIRAVRELYTNLAHMFVDPSVPDEKDCFIVYFHKEKKDHWDIVKEYKGKEVFCRYLLYTI